MTNVLTRSFDNSRSGHNPTEAILTVESVGTQGIRKLFSLEMSGDPRGSEGQPLIASVLVDGTPRNVCYAADMGGSVYAWDADTGTPLWHVHVATAVIGSNAIDAWNINVNWCFLSTPVIDLEGGVIYLCCWDSPDGSVDRAGFHVHALALTDGSAVRPGYSLEGVTYAPEGLPVQEFSSAARKQRAGLTLSRVRDEAGEVHKVLWIACGSVRESGPQARGWVIAIDLETWTTAGWTTAVKYSGGGIWQGAQGLTVDEPTGDCFGMTGNGAFDGVTEFGECFFRLRYTPASGDQQPRLTCIDHWSPFSDAGRGGADPTLVFLEEEDEDEGEPTNHMHDVNPSNYNSFLDQDLGSGGPLLLDDLGFLLGAGKDGIAYVLDVANLGKTVAADFAPAAIAQNYAKLKAPPVWFTYFPGFDVSPAPVDLINLDTLFEGKTHHQHSTPVHIKTAIGHRVFTWGENAGLRAWSIDATGKLVYLASSAEIASAEVGTPGGMPGGMLSASSNMGSPGTVLIWALIPYGCANKEITNGRFLVYDAENFEHFPDGSKRLRVLWDSEQWGIVFKFNKFNVPTIANGKIYVPTYESRIDVYGLT